MCSGPSSKESNAAAHRPTSMKYLSSVLVHNTVPANSYLSVYAKRTCPVLSTNERFLVPTFVHQRPVNGDVQINHASAARSDKPVSLGSFLERANANEAGNCATVYLDNTQFKTAMPQRKRSALFAKERTEYENLERSDKGPPPSTSDSGNNLKKIPSNASRASPIKELPTGSAAPSAVPKVVDDEASYVFVSNVHREREVAAYSPYLRAASNSQTLGHRLQCGGFGMYQLARCATGWDRICIVISGGAGGFWSVASALSGGEGGIGQVIIAIIVEAVASMM
ncbi:unnamed protein product [Schistocephalus solidus]|uniref:Uncharacterized protein n=1 Tax=Schistocephalus solidus TaxID=70667 RepID=A0A183S7Y9_SCHSO|nr:unnamed protein product [Schistocephalus solidus]